MGLSDITLKNYDTVVAVTQDAVNEALADYLDQLQKQVALYYAYGSDGNLIAVPEDQATVIFTGTLAYQTDDDDNPVDIVKLYTDKGNQTIAYNVTFSNPEFQIKPLGIDAKPVPGATWIIQFNVDLDLEPARIDQLPTNVQQAYQTYVDDLGLDAFSVQQLYVDLNFANFAQFVGVEGLPDLAQSVLAAVMKAYLASLQAQGGLIFGYTLQTTLSAQAEPTFMPTALDFCVTPYTDASGNHSDPGLDTLNYLVMTGGSPLPPYPPTSFPFNWVDDPSVAGAVAIRRDLFVGHIVNLLNPILQPICPVVTVSADGNGESVQLQGGSAQSFNIVDPPQAVSSGWQVASFSYASNPSKASWHNWDYSVQNSASASYSMSCDVTVAGNTITLSGSMTASATTNSQTGDDNDTTTMPSTTFNWSVALVLTTDLTQNGQLDLVIANPDFDSPPSVAGENGPWWQQFLNGLNGDWTTYTNNLQGIRDQVSSLLTNIEPQLKSLLASSNDFVFPGANTFLFASPQFSNSCDLAADTAYLSPSQPASVAPKLARIA
jgi:hypothetical protein